MIDWQDLKSRITGISIGSFGVSWEPREGDRQIVYDLQTALADRRVQFGSGCGCDRSAMIRSVETIRGELTTALRRLGADHAFRTGSVGLALVRGWMHGYGKTRSRLDAVRPCTTPKYPD